MATLRETFTNITSWLIDIVEIGLSLALVFLVVDLLFGATTNIVANLSALIDSFVARGVVGLIALIVFLAIYKR
jgi:flagellar biosynthesis protein FliR